MKNLNEQLKELPEEFVVEMEQQKADRWVDVYDFINNESNGWEEIIDIENLIKQDNTPYDDYFSLS